MNTPTYTKLVRHCLQLLVLGIIAPHITAAAQAPAASESVQLDVDWPGYLAQHDLRWNRLPQDWTEAPFLGNGMMGTQIYQTGDRTIRWDVGRGDVQDHRLPVRGRMNDRCRLPIGYFELKTSGAITGGSMHLDLWNAECRGTVQTEKGLITWRAFVHAEETAIVVEMNPSSGEADAAWMWHALPAVSPRWSFDRKHWREEYEPHPPPEILVERGINLCVQPLQAGGETTTAWKEGHLGAARRLIVSVAHTFPHPTARYQAWETVSHLLAQPPHQLLLSHRDWWHRFYPQSFLSIPDPYWEPFYWIQMYKLASATRRDGMLIDNQGPWLQPTKWPGAWWNLNVQLSYWPTYASNRHDLGYSLCRTLFENTDALITTVPEPYRYDSAGLGRETGQHLWGQPIDEPGGERPETGHLLWALHNCWLYYRHTMDDPLLRQHLVPLLRRAVNYHLHFLQPDEEGTLHLPQTWSPEYNGLGADSNFDLALLRWGCQTLIAADERLRLTDPLRPRWEDVLQRLTDYPADETGFNIARGLPLEYGHRHYSHLLMLYPLYLVNVNQAGAEKLMQRSLDHWFSLEGVGEAHLSGYSYTGASSISAAFGRGNDALNYLNRLRPRIEPSTFYGEGEPIVPVIETPLSAAQCIHDMLLQSWGGTIRVFPAVPDAWPDVAFHDLSAEGGFLVSAVRRQGEIQFIRIRSQASEPCRLQLKDAVLGGSSTSIREVKPGLYDIDLRQDDEVIISFDGALSSTRVRPVSQPATDGPPFGLD